MLTSYKTLTNSVCSDLVAYILNQGELFH